jgi:deoxyribodipyrimidine photo-lyase
MLHADAGQAFAAGVDDRHEVLGGQWLARWFVDEVTKPIALHVAAKRYLVRVDPHYAATLSPASKHTLALQGGPMSDREVAAFAAARPTPAAVQVRRWDEAAKVPGRENAMDPASNGARVFLSEVGWREFAHHLLFHFEHTPTKPLRADFERFPWAEDPDGKKLRAWQRGQTGYPIVDAGMRQLYATGWMHNRVRMIAASFLVKHLRLPWQQGAAWFWDTLVDADLASNTLGWQWSAGCGADAAPYFRIFAPVTQGERFDGEGNYVREWVPELAKLPDKFLHAPWTAPESLLEFAGVRLGSAAECGNYPRPLVDHATARAEALAAFKALRGGIAEADE